MLKKITALMVVLCLTIGFTCTVFADGIEYEPNDTMAKASQIVVSSGEETYTYGVCSNDDQVDWYKIKVGNVARTVSTYLFVDSTIDLDLYLYDANMNQLEWSESFGLGADESVEHELAPNTYYYIMVHYAKGTVRMPYYLKSIIVQ